MSKREITRVIKVEVILQPKVPKAKQKEKGDASLTELYGARSKKGDAQCDHQAQTYSAVPTSRACDTDGKASTTRQI
jgi:hypothetical protein